NRPSGVDLKVEVYAGDGTLLAASDNANNDQRLTVPLSAGTYYLLLSGHGDYGDVGSYNLTVSTLPTDWDTPDIGSVGFTGHARFDPAAGSYSVGGSGSDIFGTSDQFRFAYTTLTGDGTITARVVSQTNTNNAAKAGVMIRDTLAANAAEALVDVTPGAGV